MRKKLLKKPKFFVLDVDGVMTTGHFFYTKSGKVMKMFGPDDHDALLLLKKHLKIHFVTSDKKGFSITKKRIQDDMGFPLHFINISKRVSWIKKKFFSNHTIYMGDGIFDHFVMKVVFFSIAPKNAHELAKKHANFVTKRSGGDRAVAEACIHIIKKFF